jgi:hypothetical protein
MRPSGGGKIGPILDARLPRVPAFRKPGWHVLLVLMEVLSSCAQHHSPLQVSSASAAFAAEPMAPSDIQATFFDGKPFTASTTSGTQFKMIFTADGKMTRQPRGKSGKKSAGTWKLDTSGFCTTWKSAGTNCYTVVPSGKNKWSIQKGSTAVAVWAK